MKHSFFHVLILVFFFSMLLFPKDTFLGASTGLLLWFQTILPTLLPFMILTNLLLKSGALLWVCRFTSPLLGRLFSVSPYGSFAVLCGFMCGYPMGGKVTADLIRSKMITQKEGRYLLSFSNNTSPAFIASYIVTQNLRQPNLLFPSLAILVGAPILTSFLFRRYYCIASEHDMYFHQFQTDKGASLSIDECIMDGFETITKIGGYMMIFSVFISLISKLPIAKPTLQNLVLASLEITNGISMLSDLHMHTIITYVSCLSLASFGGWCSVAQTKAMLAGTEIPIAPYIIEKLITTLVTSLLAYVYISIQLL